MAAMPPRIFFRVRKSIIKKHAQMHIFLNGLETFRMIWKLFGLSENFPNGLETFRMVWKLSGRSGNFSNDLETFCMVWKLSRWFYHSEFICLGYICIINREPAFNKEGPWNKQLKLAPKITNICLTCLPKKI